MGALKFGEHMQIGYARMPDIQGIYPQARTEQEIPESYIFPSPIGVYPSFFMHREEEMKRG